VPLGLSIAASTRVGNSLGSNLPQTAKNVASAAIVLSFLLATLNATLLYSVKDVWGKLYSSDPVVIRLVGEVLPLVALFQINDGIGAVCSGILRGW
jgi:multidrug resistance protein, MATE family